MANLSAGFAAVIIYAFGPIPMYLATAEPLDPGGNAAMSGVFVAFLTAGIGTTILSLAYRQPLAVGWSMPGLIYMATSAPGHTLAEMVGACVLAAVLVAGMTLTGVAQRFAAAVPTPVVMGMLAGSTLAYVIAPVNSFGAEPLLVGAPVAGFFLARKLGRVWFPPPAGAIALGLPVLVFAGDVTGLAAGPGIPGLVPIMPTFDVVAVVPLALPLVIITLVGNLQGLAMLEAHGYRPPVRAIGIATAVMSAIHALFAAPPASMQRAALATVAGEDAGPPDGRYVAAIVASVGAVGLAFTAASAGNFTAAAPPEFIATIVGLMMLGVAVDAMKRAMTGSAPTAGFISFAVAASTLNAGGLGPASLAIASGVAVYWWTERTPAAPPAASSQATVA
jgi:benzoate membrane transport protein